MVGTLLRGPGRANSGVIDEGGLTRAVIAAFDREDGSRGQEMAAAVRPARNRLWAAAEDWMAPDLAAELRSRCEVRDASGRHGIWELRMAIADWLQPTPTCGGCRLPYVAGRSCKGRTRKCRKSRAKADTTTCLLCPHRSVAVRNALSVVDGEGPFHVQLDRNGKILLAVTDLRKDLPPAVRAARLAFDKAMGDAILANGRLIIKVQRQYYSPTGAVTRADLTQGGALGCGRALIDYDASRASFASYGIHQIRRGILNVFQGRDLVESPDELATRRRRLAFLHLEPEDLLTGMVDAAAGHPESLLLALTPVLLGDPASYKDALLAVHKGASELTEERRLGKIAHWSAARIDEGHARRTANKVTKAKTGGRRKATPKRSPMRGASLLACLRHGGTSVESFTTAEGSESTVMPSGENSTLDFEQTAEERIAQAQAHLHFLSALTALHHEDPEAAEVVRRYNGLDNVVAETFETIASKPLLCSKRKVSREWTRQLEERGQERLRLHLVALGVCDPPSSVTPTKPVTPKVEAPVWVLVDAPPTKTVVVVEETAWESFRAEASSIAW